MEMWRLATPFRSFVNHQTSCDLAQEAPLHALITQSAHLRVQQNRVKEPPLKCKLSPELLEAEVFHGSSSANASVATGT